MDPSVPSDVPPDARPDAGPDSATGGKPPNRPAPDAPGAAGGGSAGQPPGGFAPPNRRQLKIGRRRPSLWKRLSRRMARRRASRTEQTMLPVLIQVFAGFSKMDGRIDEAEIDSTLGFLRYDYPETVYSELRELYSQALLQPQNLNEIASDLTARCRSRRRSCSACSSTC